MLLLTVIAVLALLTGLALMLHPLIYLFRAQRAVRYKELIALARVRSAAQGVVEIECKLDPAPRSHTPLSGLKAGYWEVKDPFATETPICYSYDAGDSEPVRRFLVLRADNEVFLVDAEHHPFALLRDCVVVPHLRSRYQLQGAALRERFDRLFGKDSVRLVRASHKPRRSMVRFSDEQLNTFKDAAQLTLDEDVVLAGEPVRLFGDLRTLRAATAEQLGKRVAHLVKGCSARCDEAARLAQAHAVVDHQGGEYRINLLLKPYNNLPTVVRALSQETSLNDALIRHKQLLLTQAGSFGMLLTFIGVFLGFPLLTELQDALAAGENPLSWLDWFAIPVLLMISLFLLGLRHSIKLGRKNNFL